MQKLFRQGHPFVSLQLDVMCHFVVDDVANLPVSKVVNHLGVQIEVPESV